MCDNDESGFPNFNFNVSHHGDYVAIASEPVCLVGVDIVTHSVPVNEPADKFVQSFSSYFSDLEWRSICNASSSDEMLRVFYRYVTRPCYPFISVMKITRGKSVIRIITFDRLLVNLITFDAN